jgi:hypothetical protein
MDAPNLARALAHRTTPAADDDRRRSERILGDLSGSRSIAHGTGLTLSGGP